MPRFFLSKKSMTCCRVVDSKKEQGLSPFSYMQKKKKKKSGAFCVSNLGYSAHGIFLARILQWVAMHSSRESSRPTQGSNLRLLHLLWCRYALYLMSHWEAQVLFVTSQIFDLSRLRVELARRSFMTRMDRYTTVNWQKLKKEITQANLQGLLMS